jgi:hypothetical protein
MESNTEVKAHIVVVANTKEEAEAFVNAWQKAEASASAQSETHIHIVGSGCEKAHTQTKSHCEAGREAAVVLVAESEDDWEKLKAEWAQWKDKVTQWKSESKGNFKWYIASNNGENAKKWQAEAHAAAAIDLSAGAEAFSSLKSSVESSVSSLLSSGVKVGVSVGVGLGI